VTADLLEQMGKRDALEAEVGPGVHDFSWMMLELRKPH